MLENKSKRGWMAESLSTSMLARLIARETAHLLVRRCVSVRTRRKGKRRHAHSGASLASCLRTASARYALRRSKRVVAKLQIWAVSWIQDPAPTRFSLDHSAFAPSPTLWRCTFWTLSWRHLLHSVR